MDNEEDLVDWGLLCHVEKKYYNGTLRIRIRITSKISDSLREHS